MGWKKFERTLGLRIGCLIWRLIKHPKELDRQWKIKECLELYDVNKEYSKQHYGPIQK